MDDVRTRTDEIAPDVFRISSHVPGIGGPAGFSFNQFLVRDEAPFLFHTGMRSLFPAVSTAVESTVGLDRLRWISFAHVESDECGAMNDFLAAAPASTVVHGGLACSFVGDLAVRPAHKVRPGDILELGRRRLRFIPTPHVPHNWESALWFEETTRTLFVGDLFAALGDGEPVTEDDLVTAAGRAEDLFHATSMGPDLVPTLHRLAELRPETLAAMHGPSFHGDGAAQLRSLAELYATKLAA